MSSTARCVRQSAESANWLFSQMKTTGSFQVAARFIPSCTAPWPAAPSPKYATATWPVSWSFAVSAAPQACGMPGADDPVAAEDVEREVGDVHRAAEPLAVAGALAEHLGHHPAEIGAGRDQVAVRAVVPDEVVGLAHRARGADGDRLLADAAVRGADDHARLEELGGAVLEAPDQVHRAGTARARSLVTVLTSRRSLNSIDVAVGVERVEALAAASRVSRPGRRSGTRRRVRRGRRRGRRCPRRRARSGRCRSRTAARSRSWRSQPLYSSSSTSTSLPGMRSIAMSKPVASGTPTISAISRSS